MTGVVCFLVEKVLVKSTVVGPTVTAKPDATVQRIRFGL
jgi:hypothetical protein